MAEGREGLRWWELKPQSPSQMAVEGLKSISLAISPNPTTGATVEGAWPSLSHPNQPTFQVLGVLAHHFGLPRHQLHLPITPTWTSSPLRLRPLWEA